MTATFVETAPSAAVARELRVQVRTRLEREYLRLRSVERPGLVDEFALVEDGAVDAELTRALAITDYRLAAISDFLRHRHQPHPDGPVCADCCVLLDHGDGPRWVVLAALTATDLPVVPSDSALGRALIGARPGETVYYPDPSGLRTARVLAVEPVDRA